MKWQDELWPRRRRPTFLGTTGGACRAQSQGRCAPRHHGLRSGGVLEVGSGEAESTVGGGGVPKSSRARMSPSPGLRRTMSTAETAVRPAHDHRHLTARPVRHAIDQGISPRISLPGPVRSPVRIGVLRPGRALRRHGDVERRSSRVTRRWAMRSRSPLRPPGRDPTDSSWPGPRTWWPRPCIPQRLRSGTRRPPVDHRSHGPRSRSSRNARERVGARHGHAQSGTDGRRSLFLNGIEFSTDARSLFVGPPSRRPERKCRCPSRSGKPPLG